MSRAATVRSGMRFTLVEQQPTEAKPVPRYPVQLTPVPFGRPDRALGHALCQHIVDATPAIVIPFNPVTHRRVRAVLRQCGITL